VLNLSGNCVIKAKRLHEHLLLISMTDEDNNKWLLSLIYAVISLILALLVRILHGVDLNEMDMIEWMDMIQFLSVLIGVCVILIGEFFFFPFCLSHHFALC